MLRVDRSIAGQTVGKEDTGIVGGHIAIHRNHVEGIGDGGPQFCFHPVVVNRGVGSQVAEHGCHIGINHARAFRDAAQAYRFPINLKFQRDTFGARIGRHNRLCKGIAPIGAQFYLSHARLNFIYREAGDR